MECVILAAGLSRRLGMDKALIDVGSQPLISWISRRLSSRVANITIVANESNFTEISKTVTNVNVIQTEIRTKGEQALLKWELTV